MEQRPHGPVAPGAVETFGSPRTTVSSTASPSVGPSSGKPKQKRNKPTLSCKDCVEHKTKCDRGRPVCLACAKRGSVCEYSQVANIILASTENKGSRSVTAKSSPSRTLKDGASDKMHIANITHPLQKEGHGSSRPRNQVASSSYSASNSLSSSEASRGFVFGLEGVGEHPFTNYWTSKGGLAEVIRVLPTKDQADILLTKYFELIDSTVPVLDRGTFMNDYERFWSLPSAEQCKFPPANLSLHFAIYAVATQFIEAPPTGLAIKTADFYISAAHQSLRLSSYLNSGTLITCQTMILIFAFLVHDGHISDAWTFSGLTERQAYILQLNRDPEISVPQATTAEKNLRCRMWTVMLLHATGISSLLRMPCTLTQSDVSPHSLSYDEIDNSFLSQRTPMTPKSPIPPLTAEMARNDISYIRSVRAYALFCQEHICASRALGLPVCTSREHKQKLVSSLKSIYRSYPRPFGSYDLNRFSDPSRRVVRQQIVLTQSFFHELMGICADENLAAGVTRDFYGTLEAAQEASTAFFAVVAFFPNERLNWTTFLHLAYQEAILVAEMLATEPRSMYQPDGDQTIIERSKDDIRRLLDVLREVEAEDESLEARRSTHLQILYDTIEYGRREA